MSADAFPTFDFHPRPGRAGPASTLRIVTAAEYHPLPLPHHEKHHHPCTPSLFRRPRALTGRLRRPRRFLSPIRLVGVASSPTTVPNAAFPTEDTPRETRRPTVCFTSGRGKPSSGPRQWMRNNQPRFQEPADPGGPQPPIGRSAARESRGRSCSRCATSSRREPSRPSGNSSRRGSEARRPRGPLGPAGVLFGPHGHHVPRVRRASTTAFPNTRMPAPR